MNTEPADPERRPPERRAAARPAAGRDIGLAAERTRLAWRRTALAGSVMAVLTARLALSRGTVGAVVAAAGLGWLAVLVVVLPRIAGRPPGRTSLALIALASAGFAGLGVLLVLASMR